MSEDLLRRLIERWRADPAAAYQTWFLWDERLKNFRSIRRGIAQVVASVKKIPVIGNGDIRSPQDALRMMEVTGCAGLMIGRAALSVPWIFRDIWSYLTTGIIPPPPSVEQKCQLMRDHFANTFQ